MKDRFIKAIETKCKVRVTFCGQADGERRVRKCAPMDYGPSRVAKEQNDRFHVWDYESDSGPHQLSLNPDQIEEIELLQESFEPSDFITWSTSASPWFVKRDWGEHS